MIFSRSSLVRRRLAALCCGAALALGASVAQAAESGSAADLLQALVTGSVRSVERGDPGALQALSTYLDLPAPWRAQVRDAIERTDLPAQVAARAAAGGADAALWQATGQRIAALRGLDAYAGAVRVQLGRTASRANLGEATDGVQWLRIDGAANGRVQLDFTGCHPAATAFGVSGGAPGKSAPTLSYGEGNIALAVQGETAVRLDSSACSAAPTAVSVSSLPAELPVPADGRVAPGSYAVTLSAEGPVALQLPTRAGRVYEFLLAPLGDAPDPGIQITREGADEPFVQDDDGGYKLGSRAAGVVGDGKPLLLNLIAVEERGGAASLVIRETEPARQALGETRTYRSEKGSVTVLQVPLRRGSYALSTEKLSEGVDTVVTVFAPGSDTAAAENDDRAEDNLESYVCLDVEAPGDHLVRISLLEAASGTFDFRVDATERCSDPKTGE
jgi:hypothetical protein